jgi:hypothetical protein
MNLKFSIVAEREIEAAADYYEKQETGLGLSFVLEIERAIKFILQFPNAWVAISDELGVACYDAFLTMSFILCNKTPLRS